MSFNSYKEDEQLAGTGKTRTILRLLSYMRSFKKEITAVLFIMAFCVTVSFRLQKGDRTGTFYHSLLYPGLPA